MSWFSRNNSDDYGTIKYKVGPKEPPETIGCDLSDNFESYIFDAYCMYNPAHAKDTVKWEKLLPSYYKATQADGMVIVYDELDHSSRFIFPKDSDYTDETLWRREFSRRLNRMMNAKQISQCELAERLKCSQPMISYYVSGQKTPSTWMAVQMAEILDCPVGFLIHFT